MKSYPSIPKVYEKKHSGALYHVFDKLDGSNIRAEWNRKNGLYKFGTRTRLLGTDQGVLANSQGMIEAYRDKIHAALLQLRPESAILFFEFYGPGSFAGSHIETEQHKIAFIDLAIYKKGIIEPKEYLEFAEETRLPTPALLHRGYINSFFIEQVEQSTLPGMTFEGVVCKGPFERKLGHPLWCKIKSKQWMEKLKNYCGDNETLFKQLS